jgi:hypothetical protein
MNEGLAFSGQDASAIVAVVALIALVSLLLARRWPAIQIWTPRAAAIRQRLPVVTLPAIGLPHLSLPSAWLKLRRHSNSMTAEPVATAHEGPLTIDAQWSRLTGRITARIESMEQAANLQGRASSQIDAASYALERLLGELGDVMALPRPGPTLQLLPVEPRPQPTPRAEPLAA